MDQLSWQNLIMVLPLLTPVMIIIILAFIFIPLFKKLQRDLHASERLRKSGMKAKAKVLQVVDRHLIAPDDTQIIIVVEIKQGVRTKIVTTSARMLPPAIGDTLEVLYDPKDPEVAILP